MSATVAAEQRFKARQPCLVCGGGADMQAGQGIRCYGFLGSDGRYAHCTREEFAGDLELELDSGTYAHRLSGSCCCGATHGGAELKPGKIRGNDDGRRIVATYDYTDEAGRLLYQSVRFDPKDFQQRRPDGARWVWSLGDVRRVPYRLPELLAADPSAWVLIVEGEKDVDRLTALGFVATTNAMGAGRWRTEYREHFRGRRVCIIPDHDDPGEKHAASVGTSLAGEAAEVRVLRLPGVPPKGDVSDRLDASGTREQLERLIEDAPASGTAGNSHSAPGSDAPAFPMEALPPTVRALVQAAADSLRVPPEMVAVPLLGLASALIGNRLHLVLKNSWREYLTLYLAIVARPGAAKTPALGLAQWPLDALRLAAYGDELETWRQTRDREKPEKPQLRHYFSTELTVEALAGMLAGAPGVAIIRDEISGWVAAMDQYKGGKGSDRQQYLSLWSAQTLKVDRKGGGSVYVSKPVACVVGGIQPDFAGTLHDAAKRRDGFVERILPVVPEVEPALWTDAAPSTELYRDVLGVFETLDRLERTDDGYGVSLSMEARTAFVTWANENAGLVAVADGLAAGFYAKLPAHVARFALILHALWNPHDPRPMLNAARMEDAIELGEFFRAHIGRFLTLLNAAAPASFAGLATRIERIVRTTDSHAGWVARAEIYRRLGNITADELTAALDRLVEVGRVERRIGVSATKRPEQYRLSSAQYSHNPGASGAKTGSQDSNRAETTKTENYKANGHDDWTGGEEGIL